MAMLQLNSMAAVAPYLEIGEVEPFSGCPDLLSHPQVKP